VKTDGPFLTVPIKGHVSCDGRLLSADPPLQRLHMMAGGSDDGVIALPELYSLAHLAMSTGMKLERAVVVADAHHDINLWVEAAPSKDGCALAILGWKERRAVDFDKWAEDAADPSAILAEPIVLNPNFQIVSGPDWLAAEDADSSIGSHIASVLTVAPSDASELPLIDALAERKPIDNWLVGLSHSNRAGLLSVIPVWADDGALMGFAGTIAPIANQREDEISSTETPQPQGLNFGEQLAPILKQPLNRIIANAETISSRLNGPLRENYATYAQDIANAARHLAALVSDVEDLSAIDRPDFAVAQDRIELGDISRRVTGLLALKAADHQISIALPPEDQTVEAVAEFRRVLQIVLNLVGNAIRYAPDGSAISIETRSDGNAAFLAVSDQGAGIAAENRERAFEKFERLGRSGDGGSGLGLYISRRLARAMRGDLTVTNAASGGACFELRLPVSENN
jgi:signal transduction histidine kinase